MKKMVIEKGKFIDMTILVSFCYSITYDKFVFLSILI